MDVGVFPGIVCIWLILNANLVVAEPKKQRCGPLLSASIVTEEYTVGS